jgi:hypothetical protein
MDWAGRLKYLHGHKAFGEMPLHAQSRKVAGEAERWVVEQRREVECARVIEEVAAAGGCPGAVVRTEMWHGVSTRVLAGQSH